MTCDDEHQHCSITNTLAPWSIESSADIPRLPALDVLLDLEQQLSMFDIPNLPEDFPFPAIEWIGNGKGIMFFKPKT